MKTYLLSRVTLESQSTAQHILQRACPTWVMSISKIVMVLWLCCLTPLPWVAASSETNNQNTKPLIESKKRNTIFRASQPNVRRMQITRNFHILTHLLTCKNPRRILWEGWLEIAYKQTFKRLYTVITDDDKLYTFLEKPNIKSGVLVRLHSINLQDYHFVEKEKKNEFCLATANPAHKDSDQVDALHFRLSAEKLAKQMHIIRWATKRYHILNKENQINPLSQNNVLNPDLYQVITCTAECPSINQSKYLIYLCINRYMPIRYQDIANGFANYCQAGVLTLQHLDSTHNFVKTGARINFQSRANQHFFLTFGPSRASKNIVLAPTIDDKTIPPIPPLCPFDVTLTHKANLSHSGKGCPYLEMAKSNASQEIVQHLKKYRHSQKPRCEKSYRCPAVGRTEKLLKQHNNQRLQDKCHLLAYLHPRGPVQLFNNKDQGNPFL